MLKKLALLAAATSLAMGTVAAQAAQSSSVANAPAARAAADMSGASALRGRSDTTIQIAVLAIVALLIWAGTELFDDDEDDVQNPNSP